MKYQTMIRRLRDGGIGLPFFAMLALYWCWQDSYWTGLSFGGGHEIVLSVCSLIASIVPVVVAIINCAAVEAWLDSPRCMALAGIAGTAGALGLLAAATPLALLVFSAIEGGAAGFFCLTMIRVCVTRRPSYVAFLFGTSACAGFLLDAVLELCPLEFSRAARVVLPLLMGLLLLVQCRGSSAGLAACEYTDEKEACDFSDIVASIVFVGAFALSFGFMQGMNTEPILGAETDRMLSLCVRAVAVVVFVMLYVVKRLALGSALIVGMMLSVAGLLLIGCAQAVPLAALIGSLLVETGYTFCEIMTFVLLSRLAWLLGRGDLRIAASGSLATSVGATLGIAWASAAGLMPFSTSVDMAACVLLLFGASLLLVNSKVWMRLRGLKATTGMDGREDAERIQETGRLYGLTQREIDILGYLLKGRSVPYIAKADNVSENTVKSHMKHLYAKLGVHSRQELIDLLDEALL